MELLLISACYPLAKLMRHSLFECLEDDGAAAVVKRFDLDLGGVTQHFKTPNIPILSCLLECELLLISTCYMLPIALNMLDIGL